MANIKKLKLKLKSGLLTELQSDTIFGHFAWRFKEYHGEEKLAEFLDYFVKGNPIFTISDGLFEKNNEMFFPMPLKLVPPEFDFETKKDRIKHFISQKEKKSVKLITAKQLNYYLQGDLENFEKSFENSEIKKFPKFETDLRVHVEIDRQKFVAKEGQLFSENPKYLNNDPQKPEENIFISLLVKIIDKDKFDNLKCEEILKSVFELGYGKKKSSGYGQFEVWEFEDFNSFKELPESNGFISLSHYLPASTDKIKDAFYQINTKYGKLGEDKSNSENPFKPAILLMEPGSCFVTDKKSNFYGRAVNNLENQKPEIVHNGIAFTLKCKFAR